LRYYFVCDNARSPNFQIPNKFQIPISKCICLEFRIWVIGIYLELGIWYLEFILLISQDFQIANKEKEHGWSL